ncbi:MAG: SCO6745 family protein [Streptosporangiaceae bacterium]
MSARQVARRMWTLFEPIHAMTYFAAEARAAYEAAGLRGFWRGYFAGRSAPLGRVSSAPVTASFYTFAPQMVGRALPDVWDLITPDQALAVREAGAVSALTRVLGDLTEAAGVAADMLAVAADGVDCSGRVLAAANASLPVPSGPVARLWHAATVLREHRGDGHFAALLAADVDGCESNVLRAAFDLPRETIQPLRGWTDDQWDAAAGRLTGRGMIGDDGAATPAGTALRAGIEATTDAAAARPWLDEEFAADLADVLFPIARACSAELPALNPVGVPMPKEAVVAV